MREFKSIMSRTCIQISLIFVTTLTVDAANDELFRKQINSDLVKDVDYDYYFNVLEKIIEFCIRHKVYVDSNMQYGLFLIDVNLREFATKRRETMPVDMRVRLIKLLLKNNEVTKYFHEKVHQHENDEKIAQDIKLSQLFYNRTTWPRPSDKFNKDLLKQTKMYTTDQLEDMYGKWDIYFKYVFDETKYKPTPAESDVCSAQLGSNNMPDLRSRSSPACKVAPYCKQLVEEGSVYGYGLLHRLLLMVVARFSRQCVMFSKKLDKYKTDTYCMMAFNEGEYISTYSFGLPDLMFEQMALCGLLGHAQFFRNYWLKSLLQYQTSEGCFSQNFITGEFNEKLLRQGDEDTWNINSPITIMSGQCHGHFTAVAAASLSHVLRYIIETYY
ncbi:hypothetical protein PYW08_013830 [Mythimna loreyi]|uniref:Uncharacterized protein n=1 Tax=Mythimna loreyi TaxID=667449 RepID=A0ACC2R5V2_9NEOP|nr:hypothetical protein PYW08_013830 [Mythimna loreyi]